MPHATEGFYLPALEAMALSTVAVVPDCVGNRSFCRDGENCLMPALEVDALEAASQRALSMADAGRMVSFEEAVQKTLSEHTLERERTSFHGIIENLDQIW